MSIVGTLGILSVCRGREKSRSVYPPSCWPAPTKSWAGLGRGVAPYSPASWMRQSARLKTRKSTPNTSARMPSTQSGQRSERCWTLLPKPALEACSARLDLVAERLHRGDIWLADLGPDVDPHPCVLLSRDTAMIRRRRAIVAVITSNA